MSDYKIGFVKVKFRGFRAEVEYLKYKDGDIVLRDVSSKHSKFPEPLNVFLSNFYHQSSHADLKSELHRLVVEADKKM